MPRTPFSHTLRQVARFGLVGVTATAIHAMVGIFAVRVLGLGGLAANAVGFAAAWWVSFFGHYAFTFRAPAARLRALARFVPHSAAMFGIGMAATAAVAVFGPHVSQAALPVIGACIVPVLSFLSSKFFVFRA